MRRYMTAVLAGAAVFASCEAPHYQPVPHPPPPAGKMSVHSRTLIIRPGVEPPVGRIRGNVWDLQQGTVSGSAAGPCTDKEGGAHVRILWPGLTVRNGRFAHWPDGVEIAAPGVTLEDLRFENCEDCLNVTRPEGIAWTVRRCRFQPSETKCTQPGDYRGDKAIQINWLGGDSRLDDCVFADFQNALRCGVPQHPETGGTIHCRGNQFLSIGTAYHAVRGCISIAPDSDIQTGVKEYRKERLTGRIVPDSARPL